jgi:carbonic anhydrase/acetyltransferase-like protein (isoleucine patch superfamily)
MDSFIGKGVEVGAHTILQGCVIGSGCQTLLDTHLRRVVSFSNSTLANLGLADCVMGREVFVTTGVQYHGLRLGEDAPVGPLSSARPLLGGALGDRAIVGARALFQVGVALPAGSVVVMKPHEGLGRIDDKGLARSNMVWGKPDERY